MIDRVGRLKVQSLEYVGRNRWRRRALLGVPVVGLVALFTITGVRGVDFGDHWDEVDWQIQPVRDMVESGILLPRASLYPGLCKWLTLLPAIPTAIRVGLKKGSSPHDVQAAMITTAGAPAYLLTVRRLYIFVSALAILWVYGAALALRRRWWEGFIAAATLGLSWEYAYHARWVATDCILVQFSALALFMLALFFRDEKVGWLHAAAVAAGLGTGTKFPGGVLLVPIMLTGVLTLPIRDLRAQFLRLVSLGGIAFAAYLVSTPATLLDPFLFADRLSFIANYYQQGHWGYTVAGPLQHAKLVLLYFAVSFFSPHLPLAVALFASCLLGAVALVRNDRRIGAVLVGFPVVFLIYFCGRYRAMIVRNYLFLTPFLCILAARGITETCRHLRSAWMRWTLATAVTLALAANAIWLVQAGESIRHFDPSRDVAQAVAYVAKHPKTRFLLSERVRTLAAAQHLVLPANVAKVAKDRNFDQVVFFPQAEGPDGFHMKTNDPWMATAVFGQREINWGWYATWTGRDRVVAMTAAKARTVGVRLAQ